MEKASLPRLDKDPMLLTMLEKYCRLRRGEVWQDKINGHKVGCLSVDETSSVTRMMAGNKITLAQHDPPYNIVAFDATDSERFSAWSKNWVELSYELLEDDGSLYIWLGADQNNNFQPFAEFILMMKDSGFKSRSFITMRNQRGYGTQNNWMAVRQELLYYIKGKPVFNVEKVYTGIPKILKGYYKEINGEITENMERSKSEFIRAGNVWIDIQQVFYRMEENVNGCYAQKPLKSAERVIEVSSAPGDTVIDFFAHSGTTLIAAEKLKRVCYTIDVSPVYCEITIRRLENLRKNGKTGWQRSNPFAEEIKRDSALSDYLKEKYNIEIGM